MKIKKKEKKDPRDEKVQEILKVVRFEEHAHDLMVMAPQSNYDLYLRSIMSNKIIKAAYVQTREDDRTLETQTDKIIRVAKTCQWPDDLGGSSVDSANFKEINLGHLQSFLTNASQVYYNY